MAEQNLTPKDLHALAILAREPGGYVNVDVMTSRGVRRAAWRLARLADAGLVRSLSPWTYRIIDAGRDALRKAGL